MVDRKIIRAITGIILLGIVLFTKPTDTFAQDDIDPFCNNLGACDGYTHTKLEAKSGSDLFETQSKVVLLPNGSTYGTSIPFCSIYEYDSRGDDDAAWECTWERFDSLGSDAYLFTLKSINARHDTDVYIKAVAGVIDTNVFTVNENWEFYASGRGTSYDISGRVYPSNSITLIAVDTYYTDGDDDFNYMVYGDAENYYAHTFYGNGGSYIHGRVLNITAPSSMYVCQDFLRVNNDRAKWDSRNSVCGDLKYTKQRPLVLPSIYVYRSLVDYMDKDFGVVMNDFGIYSNGNSTWAELDVSMENGNADSLVWYQMSIIGYK